MPALWAQEVLSAIIALIPAPEIYTASSFFPLQLAPQLNAALGDDGLHLVIGDKTGPIRLWVADGADRRAAVVIPLDASCWIRLYHLRRLLERLYGRVVGPLPNTFRPTRYRATRLAHALQALTAKRAGATVRDIAALTDTGVRTLGGSIWKDVHQRARVERLLKLAEHLAGGEYLALLHHGHRSLPASAAVPR